MNIITYITQKQKYTQKALAEKLGVSTTQISLWKKGSNIPYARQQQLEEIAGFFSHSADWSILCDNKKENEALWFDYFDNILNSLQSEYEITDAIRDYDFHVPSILVALNKLGVHVEKTPPQNQNEKVCCFATLLEKVLIMYSLYHAWCEKVLIEDPVEISTELYDAAGEIESMAADFSMRQIPEESITAYRLDKELIYSHSAESWRTLNHAIHSYLGELIMNRLPIRYDYFEILNIDPEILNDKLYDEKLSEEKQITKYFTYPEQQILKNQKRTNELLQELLIKLDE